MLLIHYGGSMINLYALEFGYGAKPVIDALALRLERGKAYGLLGLNGAGKTSLLKLLAGALKPRAGSIEVFGRDPSRREAAALADVAFVPEDPWLPSATPRAYLERYATFRPAFDDALFERLRGELGILEDKVVSKLSYGQRKKFALAAALAGGARTILLDEPTNGLDIPSKMQFRKALAGAISDDKVIVVSTHQVRDLESLIDPILILDSGRLVSCLEAETIGARLATVRAATLEGFEVVHAERDALGWNALVARRGRAESAAPADIELVFNAALAEPARLEAATTGAALAPYAGEGRKS
jgi:ABC-2 type transport system ATP-binding protein